MGTENHPWCEARFAAAFLPPLVLFCIGGFAAAGDEVPKASNAVGLSNRPDDFKKMQQEVEPLVGKLAGEKSEEERKKIEERLVAEFGDKAIEVLIRYRESQLIPVFSRPLDHKDLFVRRLAIFGLERNGAVGEVDAIVKRLEDESFLVREIAWGGLIVVEYRCKDGSYVNGLNGHCGIWLIAEAGASVRKGQLLGVMGLGFSPENGGHGSHSHFGMFQGAFDAAKCFGRGAAGTPVEGWLVPADFLGPQVEGKPIVPESYK